MRLCWTPFRERGARLAPDIADEQSYEAKSALQATDQAIPRDRAEAKLAALRSWTELKNRADQVSG